MTTIVVYAGGFQPFHQGHLSSYLQAKQAFPDADFYVAASGNVKERPIPYEEKKFLAVQAGVNPKDFPNVAIKSPMNPKEILEKYNPEQDVFILVRSERDPVPYTKKDGSPGYFQPYTGENIQPFGKHGYVYVTDKHDFNVNGQSVYSGTQVRDMYTNADDKTRLTMIKQLYPNSKQQKQIKKILDTYLGNTLAMESIKRLYNQIKPLINEATEEQKAKLYKLLEDAKKQYEAANPAQQAAIAISKKEKLKEKIKWELPHGKEKRLTANREGLDLKLTVDDTFLTIVASKDGKRLGFAKFVHGADGSLDPYYVRVQPEHRGKGIAKVMYDYAKELGYDIHRTIFQSDDGKAFWNKHKGEEAKVWEGKSAEELADKIVDVYEPILRDVQKEKVEDYVKCAKHLYLKAENDFVREKLLDIFKKGKSNPYLQGGIITTIGALLAGGVLSTSSKLGLNPHQTNIALQAIMNTVIPAVVSRVNGKDWKDTVKYTLASAGIGTGIAAITENQDYIPE